RDRLATGLSMSEPPNRDPAHPTRGRYTKRRQGLNHPAYRKSWARNGSRGGARRGQGGPLLPSPQGGVCKRSSAERHFRDEQVVAARPVHVRVEDHHFAIGARLPKRQGPVVEGDLETVVVQEQPR